jgi:integrase
MGKPKRNISVKGLVVYCNKCKLKVNINCGLTKKRLNTCHYLNRHKYKIFVYVPGANGKAKTRLLNTKNENEAIKQALEFRKELELNCYSTKITSDQTQVPKTLLEGMAYYISYLNNETPHQQEHKQRTKGHKNDVERIFRFLVEYLESIGINPVLLKITDVDKTLVGKLKTFLLEEKDHSPKTYNKYISLLRIFFDFITKEFEFTLKNPFNGFKRLKTVERIETISKGEFQELLKIITPERGIKILGTGEKKNIYKPWLKNAFLLAILTGRRREEIVSMKFSGIIEKINGEPMTIVIEDYKVNRSNDLSEKEPAKNIYIPVIESLKNLLMEMGYSRYKGQDKYILAHEEQMTRKTMMDFISKSFSHYYRQLNTGKDLNFYDLRKTYISHLYAAHGEKAKIITRHSGDDVMRKHYIDEKVISEVARDFDVFDLQKDGKSDSKSDSTC